MAPAPPLGSSRPNRAACSVVSEGPDKGKAFHAGVVGFVRFLSGFCQLYGFCCMVVVWFRTVFIGLVLGNATQLRVNHPECALSAGLALGGWRSPRAIYLLLQGWGGR